MRCILDEARQRGDGQPYGWPRRGDRGGCPQCGQHRSQRLRSEDSDLLVRMEKLFNVKLAFRADPNYHVENFKIINANTNEEYR